MPNPEEEPPAWSELDVRASACLSLAAPVDASSSFKVMRRAYVLRCASSRARRMCAAGAGRCAGAGLWLRYECVDPGPVPEA